MKILFMSGYPDRNFDIGDDIVPAGIDRLQQAVEGGGIGAAQVGDILLLYGQPGVCCHVRGQPSEAYGVSEGDADLGERVFEPRLVKSLSPLILAHVSSRAIILQDA